MFIDIPSFQPDYQIDGPIEQEQTPSHPIILTGSWGFIGPRLQESLILVIWG